eukprot:3650623-Amphidinium_carterae.1
MPEVAEATSKPTAGAKLRGTKVGMRWSNQKFQNKSPDADRSLIQNYPHARASALARGPFY